jgi:ribonuclease P protein component
MKFTYPKNEKLKQRKLIDKLFTQGKSVAKYPLRLVFMEVENTEQPFQLSVSVSKKYFKNAVDRNRFKRLLREAYRLNQHILKENNSKSYIFMFFYQTKEILSFEEINKKTVELFEKFNSLQNSK